MMIRKPLIFAALAVAAFSAAAFQGVVLRHELKEGATEAYTVKTDMQQTVSLPNGMGDQDLTIVSTATTTFKVGKIDPATGLADVETIVSDMETKTDGALAGMMGAQAPKGPKEVRSQGKLDARNRLTVPAAKSQGAMEMLFGGGGGTTPIFIEFPENAVNVGDSWKMFLPKSPLLGKDAQSITAKLAGEKEVDGVKAWVVSLSGTINVDTDLSEAMKNAPNNPMAGQKMMLKGTMTVNGEALVEKGTGRTLSMNTNSKSVAKMEMPEQGMSIDINGNIKSVVALKK